MISGNVHHNLCELIGVATVIHLKSYGNVTLLYNFQITYSYYAFNEYNVKLSIM